MKILLLLVLYLFTPFIIIKPVTADEPDILPPTYSWLIVENPWDELTEEEKNATVPAGPLSSYLIKSEKLSIHYPTQNIDVDFVCRKYAMRNIDGGEYDVCEDIGGLAITYYDKSGRLLWSGISALSGVIIQRFDDPEWGYEHKKALVNHTDVYFIDNGKTLCWNVSHYFWTWQSDPMEMNLFLNYSINYVFKIRNYANDTIFFETDTIIEFYAVWGKIPPKLNITVSYGYDLLDLTTFQMIYPTNLENGTVDGWYKIGDYDVMAILTADQVLYTFDNGTSLWTNLSRGMVVTPPTPTNSGVRYLIYMYNLPFNNTKGNVTRIYYDPIMLGFYEARPNYLIELCMFPAAVIIMVFVIRRKKLATPTNIKGDV